MQTSTDVPAFAPAVPEALWSMYYKIWPQLAQPGDRVIMLAVSSLPRKVLTIHYTGESDEENADWRMP